MGHGSAAEKPRDSGFQVLSGSLIPHPNGLVKYGGTKVVPVPWQTSGFARLDLRLQ